MTELGPFTGLDLRPSAANSPGALVEALNVIVDTHGALIRRPALNFRASLPTATVGLYAVGDTIKTVAYQGVDDTGFDPTIYFDYVSTDVTGGDLRGAMVGSDGKSLVFIETASPGSLAELHHCLETGVDGSTVTKLTPGFPPNACLIGMEGRGWCFSQTLAKLWHSGLDAATPQKLDNWTTIADDVSSGGFFSVGQFSVGAGRPTALGDFGGRMAIFFEGAVQVWRLDTDRTRVFKDSVIPSVGCKAPRSVASVVSDIVFLSNAGIRSLTNVLATLLPSEDPVGSRVDTLVNQLANETGANPVGLYARRLGCYLLAFGSDVICMSLTPGQKVNGFSRWELPVDVDYMVEGGGKVWIRSANNLFSLDEYDDDDTDENGGTSVIPVRWESASKRYANSMEVTGVTTTSMETHRVQVVADGRPPVDNNGLTTGSPIVVPGRSPTPVFITQSKEGRVIALRGQDDSTLYTWRLDAASFTVSPIRNI
jgi:hypothetical protein